MTAFDIESSRDARQYAPVANADANATVTASVNLPPPASLAGIPYIDRVGTWEYVHATAETVHGRADFSQVMGIYTGAIGGCAAIAVAYGDDVTDKGGDYKSGALVHLAGSNLEDAKWNELMPVGGKEAISQRVTANPHNVAAVVFLDTARQWASPDYVNGIEQNLGIPKSRITVYASDALSHAGLCRDGRFGITRRPGTSNSASAKKKGCCIIL